MLIVVLAVIFFCIVIGLLMPDSEEEIPAVLPKTTKTVVSTALSTKVPTETFTPEPTEDLNVDNPTWAAIMCEDFVLSRLKAPASAKFPGLFDEWPKIMPFCDGKSCQDWHVVSYVDAQNTYGAMIRNFYTCQISYVGNDQWKLLDLWFHE